MGWPVCISPPKGGEEEVSPYVKSPCDTLTWDLTVSNRWVTRSAGCAAWCSGALLEARLPSCCLRKQVEVSSLDPEARRETVSSCGQEQERRGREFVCVTWGGAGRGSSCFSALYNFPRVGDTLARQMERGLSCERALSCKGEQNHGQSSFLCSCTEMEGNSSAVCFVFTLTCKTYLIIPD